MKACRTDANHASIRDALRKIPGVSVADTSAVGGGFPDLVVAIYQPNKWLSKTVLMEVKDGDNKPPSECKLTPAQQEFHANWMGRICVVNNLNEALRTIGIEP